MTGERTRKSRGWRERRPILRWSRETAHKSHPARAPRPARGRTLLGRERQPQPVCTPLWLGHRHRNTLPPFKILSFTDTPSSPSLVFLPPLSHPPGKSRKVMPFILRASLLSHWEDSKGWKTLYAKSYKLTKWKHTFVWKLPDLGAWLKHTYTWNQKLQNSWDVQVQAEKT